ADDRAAIEAWADTASLLLRNARLYEELQKSAERLQRVIRGREHFLQDVNHELRTPLTAIIGWAEVLSEDRPDEAAAATAVEQSRRSAEHLVTLVSDLLDLARLEEGASRVDRKKTDVALLVRSVLDALAVLADARGRQPMGIVFSDATRPLPRRLLLEAVLEELAGVPREDIILFNALGTHRPSPPEELVEMLGPEIAGGYRIVQNGGKGTARITDSRTGSFTYTPKSNINGTDTFTFKVNDGKTDSNEATVTVVIAPVNDPLTISGNPAAFIAPNSLYSFTPTVTNPDGTMLVYEILNKPAWADFNPDTGTLSGTPGAGDVGTAMGIVISATDGVDTVSLAPFSITVLGTTPVTTISPKEGTYSTPQQIKLTCQDAAPPACDIIYYTVDGTEPAIAPANKYAVPFTISTTTTVKYFAINATGNKETPYNTAIFTIDATPPVVAIASPVSGTSAKSFPTISGTASDGGSGLYSLTLKIHHLEKGLYLSQNNGVTVLTQDAAGRISLTAPGGDWSYTIPSANVNLPAGVYAITVEATDMGGNTAFQTVMFSYMDAAAMAYTELTLNLSSEAILENKTIDVAGQLIRRTDVTTPLAGQTVSLSVNTISTGTATTDQEGKYLFANVG
ncbi:MAG: histidine kinase dimerization/phospho-acceptor domain-containing protein, partial [Deltaproteobacteria bacterium]